MLRPPDAAEPPRFGPAVVSSPAVIRGDSWLKTADDLSTPLGQDNGAPQTRRFRLPFTAMQALAVLLGLFLVGLRRLCPVQRQSARRRADGADRAAAAEPGGRESRAAHPGPTPRPPGQGSRRQAPPASSKTVTIIDGSSGKRQDVVVGGDAAAKDGGDAAPRADGRHRPAAAGEIPLRHDPRDRRRAEAVHGLCGRGRPRQGRDDAGHRHRGRRPRRRRRQDRRTPS